MPAEVFPSSCPYINPVVGSTVKAVIFIGEEAKGVKFPAIVPPIAGRGINSNNINSERNNTRAVVAKRLEILDFNMIFSLSLTAF